MKRKNQQIRPTVMSMEFDWVLFLLTIGIAIFGLINIYSATKSYGTNSSVVVQSVSFVMGIAGMLALSRFDYEQFKSISKYIYIFSLFILVLVFFFGVSGDWGAKNWIRIGSIGIQPSEIAKVCFILTFSHHLARVEKQINRPVTLLCLLIHAGVIIGLILAEPDVGSSLVFMFMVVCLLFVARISWKYIIPVAVAGVASLPFIYRYVLDEYQQKRIQVFFNPDLDPLNRGYNVIQSKIAVGSGQLWGKGYLEGTQNQMEYLPTKSTDFIFSVIAEEWGFIGAVVLVAALFALIFRCYKVAMKADNSYGKYICVGVASMFLFHVFENVGMCIGLMPVTGIPLPLVSYGGSSMLTNCLAIGLVLSVNYHNKPRTIVDVY